MEINYNIVSIIDIIGLIQGLVLGTLLVIINQRKKSTIFLGLSILSFSTGFIPLILADLHITEYYPQLLLLPFQNQWILVALFYIYIQKISIFSNKKISYPLLYPGLIFYVFQMVIFCFPAEIKIDIHGALWYNTLILGGMVYSTVLLIFALKLVEKHLKEVKNQFSSAYKKHLRWMVHYIYFSLFLAVMTMYIIFNKDDVIIRCAYSIIYAVMVFWVSIKGVMQYNVVSIIEYGQRNKRGKGSEIQTTKITLSNTELQDLALSIEDYMNASQVFSNSELTIIDMAKALDEHPRQISKALNTVIKQNFNSYVNQYRIKKAEKLLLAEEASNLSIEGIGFEVGFHSKSAFYSAFKKVTGTTPSKFKNSIAG